MSLFQNMLGDLDQASILPVLQIEGAGFISKAATTSEGRGGEDLKTVRLVNIQRVMQIYGVKNILAINDEASLLPQ